MGSTQTLVLANVFIELRGELAVDPAVTTLRFRIRFQHVFDDGSFAIADVDYTRLKNNQQHVAFVAHFGQRIALAITNAKWLLGRRRGKVQEEEKEDGRYCLHTSNKSYTTFVALFGG